MTWLGLTLAQVLRHPSTSITIHKGHLDHRLANGHSTQPAPVVVPTDGPTDAHEAHDDTFPPEPPFSRSHYIYADCQSTTGMVYMDPTCRFLQPSTSGNWYVLLVYYYYIHTKPMPTRANPYIIAAYKHTCKLLK
jgi:hypothetical protein